MPQLFRETKDVLEDLASTPEEDALETEPQLIAEVGQLSQTAETELQGTYSTSLQGDSKLMRS